MWKVEAVTHSGTHTQWNTHTVTHTQCHTHTVEHTVEQLFTIASNLTNRGPIRDQGMRSTPSRLRFLKHCSHKVGLAEHIQPDPVSVSKSVLKQSCIFPSHIICSCVCLPDWEGMTDTVWLEKPTISTLALYNAVHRPASCLIKVAISSLVHSCHQD